MRDSPAGPVRGGGSNGVAISLGGSAALAGIATALLLTDHRILAGLAALGACAGLVVGAVLARPDAGPRATLAANVLDRAYDASLLGPLAWISRSTAPRIAVLALLCLGAGFTAAYERTKAASLGYRATEGVGYRGLRAGLPAVGLLTGWVEASLWVLTAVTVVTTAGRALNVVAQHGRERRLRSGTVRGP